MLGTHNHTDTVGYMMFRQRFKTPRTRRYALYCHGSVRILLILALLYGGGLGAVLPARADVALLYEPDDPYYVYDYQWDLDAVNAPQAWDIFAAHSMTQTTVAVIDSGIDFDHPDLQGRTVEGHTWVTPEDSIIWMYPMETPSYFDPAHPWDDNEHGTMVSGIIAANTDNNCGIAGLGNNWLDIMPLRVINTYGEGEDYDGAEAIIWAADHGADVINMSLGGPPGQASPMEAAVQYAYNQGVALVAAAGNDGDTDIDIPAAYKPYVLAVGSIYTDANDEYQLSDFSDHGPLLDVVAPGENFATTYPSEPIEWLQLYWYGEPYNPCTDPYIAELTVGTSFAAPIVSAQAALLRGLRPALTNAELYDVIRSTAYDLGATGRDDTFGWGLVDFEAAALKALEYEKPIPEPTTTVLLSIGMLALAARLRRRQR